jgi:DNA primase
MEEEKYELHNWERKDVYVKAKKQSASQFLNETILHLRKLLIGRQINSMAQDINQKQEDEKLELLQNIQEYKKLEVMLSRKLETVIRRIE